MTYLAVTQSDGLELLCELLSSVGEVHFGQRRIQVSGFSDSCQILGYRELHTVSFLLFSQVHKNSQETKRGRACPVPREDPPGYPVFA